MSPIWQLLRGCRSATSISCPLRTMSDVPTGVIGTLDGRVLFTRRPTYVPVAARVPWRLAVMCLVLSRFRNYSARVEHLHMVHWALTNPTTRRQLKVWLDGIR